MNYTNFCNDLIYWYEQHRRDLPWRKTRNAYLIWLSEIILQQTRVSQGLPYYLRFEEKYPTLQDLAQANESEVLRLWQGLGYYSRARNMLKTARYIEENLKGRFPESYSELVKLKGVGRYTAGAIASFAYKEIIPVVDGNVMRVLSRVYGVFEDISSSKGQNYFVSLAEKMLPKHNCDVFNQALMEFGATICTPKKPKCAECIFNHTCFAYQKDLVSSLPVKIKRTIKKIRELNYFVIKQNNKLLMKERIDKDIWKGLFEFYIINNEYQSLVDHSSNEFIDVVTRNAKTPIEPKETITHILTHQVIKAKFWEIEVDSGLELPLESTGLKFYSMDEINGLPKSVLIMKYLNKNYF